MEPKFADGRSVVASHSDPAAYEYQYREIWTLADDSSAHNFDSVNELLAAGWEPVRETPGGTIKDPPYVSWLVLLRRSKTKTN